MRTPARRIARGVSLLVLLHPSNAGEEVCIMAGRSTYATCGAILALIAAGAVAPARAEPAADAKGSPIEFIVPFGPGGGADQLARRIAPRLSEVLGTEVAVTNIPCATGNVGM